MASYQNLFLVTVTFLGLLLGWGCARANWVERGEAGANGNDPPRDIYGVGVTWSDWLPGQLPAGYQDNPRRYDQAQLDLIAEAGGTATSGTFDWVTIEPVEGTYVWERADQRTEDALDRGLTIYAYLGNTPEWARPENGLPGHRTPPAEEYAGEFMDYCRAVANRYKGKVERFFFWNEPNGCSWVNDGCSNSDGYALYTKWLKRAYVAVKEGNPDAIVAAGSLDYGTHVPTGYTYLEGMYAAGAQGFFDAFDIHPYADDGVHWTAIRDIRRVLDAHGDTHIPVWISEYGWENSGGADVPVMLTETLQTLKTEEYEHVTFARYLVMSDLPFSTKYGMVDRSLEPRPIYDAFARLEK